MKHLYLGSFVTPGQDNYIRSGNKTIITHSTTTFQRDFISGFQGDSNSPHIINCPDIGSWPKRSNRLFIKKSQEVLYGCSCSNLYFCNLTRFKGLSISHSLVEAGIEWANQYPNELKVITVYGLIYPYVKAAVKIKQMVSNVKICCIVADLPEYFNDSKSRLFNLLINPSTTYKLVEYIDSFVLLTKQMCEPLNVGNRPWMIMEGLYQRHEILSVVKVPKSVLYTGKLDSRFGIKNLVDSFVSIEDKEVELWICGDGVDRNYVLNAAKRDKRIKYFGVISQQEVFKKQQEASLLINPRLPFGEYTKYSFPSKTMEYLASGTPTLMYKLPGMPEEYCQYVVILDEHRDDSIKAALQTWLIKEQQFLDEFGKKAREFILSNKTASVQVRRYLEFINKIYGDK